MGPPRLWAAKQLLRRKHLLYVASLTPVEDEVHHGMALRDVLVLRRLGEFLVHLALRHILAAQVEGAAPDRLDVLPLAVGLRVVRLVRPQLRRSALMGAVVVMRREGAPPSRRAGVCFVYASLMQVRMCHLLLVHMG